MLPMFQRELVTKRSWLSEEEVTDLFSISQCLPGIIATNTAIFVGYKQKGVSGGITAALGIALPSIIIILLVAIFLANIAEIPAVQSAFTGLRIGVSVLIINAVFKLRKKAVVDLPAAAIFVAAFILSLYMFLPMAAIIAIGGVCGIAISTLRKRATPGGTPSDDIPTDDTFPDETPSDDTLSDKTPSDDDSPPGGAG